MRRSSARFGLLALGLIASFVVAGTAMGALKGNENARGGQVLIGNDDDDPANPTIQPPGVTANSRCARAISFAAAAGPTCWSAGSAPTRCCRA
jgi:hypothetical protein